MRHIRNDKTKKETIKDVVQATNSSTKEVHKFFNSLVDKLSTSFCKWLEETFPVPKLRDLELNRSFTQFRDGFPDIINELDAILVDHGYSSLYVAGSLFLALADYSYFYKLPEVLNNQYMPGTVDFSVEAFFHKYLKVSFNDFITYLYQLDAMITDKIKTMSRKEKQSIFANASNEILNVNTFNRKYDTPDLYNSMLANIKKSFKSHHFKERSMNQSAFHSVKKQFGARHYKKICISQIYSTIMNKSELVAQNCLTLVKK